MANVLIVEGVKRETECCVDCRVLGVLKQECILQSLNHSVAWRRTRFLTEAPVHSRAIFSGETFLSKFKFLDAKTEYT